MSDSPIKITFYIINDDNGYYQECIIYDRDITKSYRKDFLGCFADLKTIRLSDGRVIQTNDLWMSCYFKKEKLPSNPILGKIEYQLGKMPPDEMPIDECVIYKTFVPPLGIFS
jgi:hypothetical protein